MTERKKGKFDINSEIKAILIILFAILGFLLVKENRVLYFAIFASISLILVGKYIVNNNLSISKNIFSMILSFFNVSSLAFMVQYLMNTLADMKIYDYIFFPFMKEGMNQFLYILWIFILSSILLILLVKANKDNGDSYVRK